MHPNPRKILPIFLLVVVVAALWWYVGNGNRANAAEEEQLSGSGTIEGVQVNVAAESGGRIVEITAGEGDTVEAGQVLIHFDALTLDAQYAQAQAALAQAEANYALVAAGQPAEQRQAAIAAAELEVLNAQQALDLLNDKAGLTAAAAQKDLAAADIAVEEAEDILERLEDRNSDELELALARANLDLAVAQQADAQHRSEQLQDGPDPEDLALAEARLEAAEARLLAAQAGPTSEQLALAEAQVETAKAALQVLDAQRERLTVEAPISGVVLARSVQPGEIALPGAPLLSLVQLEHLSITIYLPEDRYGTISLGQEATVEVDSFPGITFSAVVTYIANQAEFTPRNVQTAEGRRTTVFAVKLDIQNQDGRLKPGMPADVSFGE